MKNLIIIILLSSIIFSVNAQKIQSLLKNDPMFSNEFYYVEDSTGAFIIDRDLTKNWEYLTYLAWIYNVYVDYPEPYEKNLPDSSFYNELFNPDYAMEPVKRLTLEQAADYCIWRYNRYNEWIMIREGLLHLDFGQINEESFNTETYLCDQYLGIIKALMKDPIIGTERKAQYRDYFLTPSFFVANEIQIDKTNEQIKNAVELKIPKKIKSPLVYWFKQYINSVPKDYEPMLTESRAFIDAVNDGDVIQIPNPMRKYFLSLVDEKDLNTEEPKINVNGLVKKISEVNSDKNELLKKENIVFNSRDLRRNKINLMNESIIHYTSKIETTVRSPFYQENFIFQNEKDSLGFMPFIYIADETNGTPLLLKKKSNTHSDSKTYEGFYCVMNIPYRLQVKLRGY